MANTSVLQAEVRNETGTGKCRGLRREGHLPCMLQGLDGASSPIQVSVHELLMLLTHHAGEHLVLDLKLGDNKPRKVLLKELQHAPISGNLVHADFAEISMTEKMQTNVQLVLAGEPTGVTQGGGTLEHLLWEVEVECLPNDLVEEIEVDVSSLDIGGMVTVADIPTTPGIEILTEPDIAVALVSAPRLEEEPAEGEGEEAGEPERVGEKKEEEGETEG